MESLSIDGALLFTPDIHHDHHGASFESFRRDELEKATGHELQVAQANCAIFRKGVVRGIHFTDVPPGQARYVSCVAGAVFDVVVDVRVGSPTYGRWHGVVLDDRDHRGLYLGTGLGHAVMALSDEAAIVCLYSQPHAPERERSVHPLDPEIAVDWPAGAAPVLSDRDAAAPTLAEARAAGLLPDHETCLDHIAGLRGY